LSGGRYDEKGVFARWVRWVRMMGAMDEKGPVDRKTRERFEW
jgi:hypothetical protein